MCPPLLGCIAEEGVQNMRSGLRDMVRAAAGGPDRRSERGGAAQSTGRYVYAAKCNRWLRRVPCIRAPKLGTFHL